MPSKLYILINPIISCAYLHTSIDPSAIKNKPSNVFINLLERDYYLKEINPLKN